MIGDALLSVRDLRTYFATPVGPARAVDGVSFDINAGEVLALVGESGCGKSVTAASILRLIPMPPGEIVGGEIVFEGVDLLDMSAAEMRRIRGDRIAMIFQDPMTSLNPVLSIGDQVAEAIREHRAVSKAAAWARAVELLDLVRIPEPALRARDFPHRLSGGMRQRVMIAMALACEPRLLIADEPTTALDVTVQAQILALLDNLRRELGTAILLITHDLGVVAETADRVAVMYAGRIVEQGTAAELFMRPLHPYTRGLLASLPGAEPGTRLVEIPGVVPPLTDLRQGCAFAPRCPLAMRSCLTSALPSVRGNRHAAACLRITEEAVA